MPPPVVQIPATSYKLTTKQDWTFILFYIIQTSGCSDHHDPESSAYHLYVLEYFTWLLSCMFPFCATLHFFSTTFSDIFFFTSHCLFVTFPPSCMLQICIKMNCLWFVEHFWYLNRMFRWPDAEFVPLTARPRERWGWKWASFLLCFQEKLTFKGVFFFLFLPPLVWPRWSVAVVTSHGQTRLFFSQARLAPSPHTFPLGGDTGGGAAGALIGTSGDVVQGEPAEARFIWCVFVFVLQHSSFIDVVL